MKSLRRFCAGFVLALAFALPAFAGHIPCGVTCVDPEHTQDTTEATPTGPTDEAGDVLTETLAALLNGLLIVL